MIRTLLEFELAPGKADAFVDFFDRHDILATAVAQDGCSSAELMLSADGSRAVVTATWSDAAAYAAWTSRSDRGQQAGELSTYLRDDIDPSHAAEPLEVVRSTS